MNDEGRPAHGWTAALRRRPVRIAQGRPEGGYTEEFEIVCCDCGDDPDLDYRQVSPELQQIRGPYPIAAGITAYVKHARRHPTPQRTQQPAGCVTQRLLTGPGSYGSGSGRLEPGSMNSQAAHAQTARRGPTLGEPG
jgi:hypothetical protein